MSRKIIGESPAIQETLKMIGRLAPNKTNVLITGESGTGKELVARMIHDDGPLKDRPFVPVNCGAIPENLIESEMFGHKKGSFTGAVSDKVGLFQTANGGTLFLDEVGELPLSMQVKLLRALQERSIRKVGGVENEKIDIRIIAATNRDLEDQIAQGAFREDLYYRLNVIMLKTPPLRDRGNDVELLADFFLQKMKDQNQKKELPVKRVSDDVMELFKEYPWPGNVRELENVMVRAITLESTDEVTLSSLPLALQKFAESGKVNTESTSASRSVELPSESTEGMIQLPAPDFSKGPIDLESILGEVEKAYLEKAIEQSGGVKKKAAELLGITFRSIRYRLKKLGID